MDCQQSVSWTFQSSKMITFLSTHVLEKIGTTLQTCLYRLFRQRRPSRLDGRSANQLLLNLKIGIVKSAQRPQNAQCLAANFRTNTIAGKHRQLETVL